jgi:hypothetical protein
MGSWEYSLPSLALYGSVESNGGSYDGMIANGSIGGPGGGSGGTILLFVHTLSLAESSLLSSVGGLGSAGSGGGGGGRIHFHWSNIPIGDEYVPVAAVKGSILTRSGHILSLVFILLPFFWMHSVMGCQLGIGIVCSCAPVADMWSWARM